MVIVEVHPQPFDVEAFPVHRCATHDADMPHREFITEQMMGRVVVSESVLVCAACYPERKP